MRLPLLAIPMALLSACAATPPQEEGPRTARTDACVFHSSISGFKALDDSRVILYDGIGNKHAYLAEITPGCFDLSHQSQLAAIDGDGNGRICGYGRDDIAYQQFGRIERCRVLRLEKLTDERLAAVMEKKVKKPRKVIIE
ncbi:MAG: hypothetical protein HW417_85 [Steroidobacteraceae bacterium]|nr:hypothetical protein [Steroidobacteraceae bacterium]